MTTFKVTVFLFFSLFLKGTIISETTNSVTQTNPIIVAGTTTNGTTTVATSNPNSSVANGKTVPRDVVSPSTTTEVSNRSSVTNASTITSSIQSENSTAEITISVRTETTVNTSTGDNATSFSVTSNGQSMYSTTTSSGKELEDYGSESQPTPTPATSGTSSLSVLAFAVIILILILVIVVVILVSVISLRFKCCDCQETPQDTSKARNETPSESSHANGEKESITLVSMRSLYTEAGGQESSMQMYLQNESTEVDEMTNNFSK